MPEFAVTDMLESGELQIIEEDRSFAAPFHIVYIGRARTLPRRVEIVIEFLAQHGRLDHA